MNELVIYSKGKKKEKKRMRMRMRSSQINSHFFLRIPFSKEILPFFFSVWNCPDFVHLFGFSRFPGFSLKAFEKDFFSL